MWIENKKCGHLPYFKGEKVVAYLSDRLSQAVLTEAISNATVDFINRHRDESFFAYVPFAAPHLPRYVLNEPGRKAEALGLDDNAVYIAQITEIDNCVGRVMETLRKHGIAEQTLVFFTNDNGGRSGAYEGGPIPLRGGKFGQGLPSLAKYLGMEGEKLHGKGGK